MLKSCDIHMYILLLLGRQMKIFRECLNWFQFYVFCSLVYGRKIFTPELVLPICQQQSITFEGIVSCLLKILAREKNENDKNLFFFGLCVNKLFLLQSFINQSEFLFFVSVHYQWQCSVQRFLFWGDIKFLF